jgi:hypothetical protein
VETMTKTTRRTDALAPGDRVWALRLPDGHWVPGAPDVDGSTEQTVVRVVDVAQGRAQPVLAVLWEGPGGTLVGPDLAWRLA